MQGLVQNWGFYWRPAQGHNYYLLYNTGPLKESNVLFKGACALHSTPYGFLVHYSKELGYQEARLANIFSRVAGAHCDEVDENPEASRQQAVAHQYRV